MVLLGGWAHQSLHVFFMLYIYLIIKSNPNPPVDGSAPQRARSVMHALARVNNHGTRPLPEEQRVPGYSGAQSCCHPPREPTRASRTTTQHTMNPQASQY